MVGQSEKKPSNESWDSFLKSLFSPLPGLREMALLELPNWYAYGRDVTGLLEMSLRDSETMVCRAAAIMVGRLRVATPMILSELEKKLAVDDELLKRTIVTTLSRLGAKSIPLMIRLLADRDPFVRRFAAVSLEDLGEAAVEPLVEALSQESLRRNAGSVLARIGNPAIPFLLKNLDHQNREIQYISMDILEEIGPYIIPALIQEIKFGRRQENSGGDAITRFGQSAIPNLAQSLHDPDVFHRCWAAATLVKIGPPAIHALTTAVCGENTSVCWLAGKALVQIGAPSVPDLLTILGSQTRSIRWIAADILAQIGEEAIAALERTILDGDRSAREAAIHALGLMGEPAWRTIRFLNERLQAEKDPAIQGGIKEAIEKLAAFQ